MQNRIWTIGGLLLILGLAWNNLAMGQDKAPSASEPCVIPQTSCGTCDDPCGSGANCRCDPRFVFFADAINWKANFGGMAVASSFAADPNTGNQTAFDPQAVSEPWASGFRLGLGYRFASKWDFTWTYTYFFSQGFTAIPGPLVVQDVGFLTLADAVNSTNSLKYDVNDLEFGHLFEVDDSTNIRVFGGFRWAILNRHSVNDFFVSAPNPQFYTLDNANTNAYGIRMGIETRWKVRNSGFGLFGRLAGSVLAGEEIGQFSTTQPGAILTAHSSCTQALPVLEMMAGMSYQTGNWNLGFGYEMAAWFNAATYFEAANPTPDGIANGSFRHNDLLLDGFFVRLAYNY
jgi:hypothetical protein